MNTNSFPSFNSYLTNLDGFISKLVENYQQGSINSWGTLDKAVKEYFDIQQMEETESVIPGWTRMASYTDGITLTHVICVFLGMSMLPEYKKLNESQKNLVNWIVLFHDVEKIHIKGKRDFIHGFVSASTTAKALGDLGFSVTDQYKELLSSWGELTRSAIAKSENGGDDIQDNKKLPRIIAGIDEMFGDNTAGALITKGVLLHMSVNVVLEYPQAAPLSNDEIKQYIGKDLTPLLKVMMLADNDGWTLFYPETREQQRRETLEVFEGLEKNLQ